MGTHLISEISKAYFVEIHSFASDKHNETSQNHELIGSYRYHELNKSQHHIQQPSVQWVNHHTEQASGISKVYMTNTMSDFKCTKGLGHFNISSLMSHIITHRNQVRYQRAIWWVPSGMCLRGTSWMIGPLTPLRMVHLPTSRFVSACACRCVFECVCTCRFGRAARHSLSAVILTDYFYRVKTWYTHTHTHDTHTHTLMIHTHTHTIQTHTHTHT